VLQQLIQHHFRLRALQLDRNSHAITVIHREGQKFASTIRTKSAIFSKFALF
jgi:hypothetical protein